MRWDPSWDLTRPLAQQPLGVFKYMVLEPGNATIHRFGWKPILLELISRLEKLGQK